MADAASGADEDDDEDKDSDVTLAGLAVCRPSFSSV